jgi:hypothetical protein
MHDRMVGTIGEDIDWYTIYRNGLRHQVDLPAATAACNLVMSVLPIIVLI